MAKESDTSRLAEATSTGPLHKQIADHLATGSINWPAVARSVAARGRGTDTMLAHLTPREMAILKAHGGSGTVNPRTGLVEFMEMGGTGAVGSAPDATAGAVAGTEPSVLGGATLGGPQLDISAPAAAPTAATTDVTAMQAARSAISPALALATGGFNTAGVIAPGVHFGGLALNAIQGTPENNTPLDLMGLMASISPVTALGLAITEGLNAAGIKGDAGNVSGSPGPEGGGMPDYAKLWAQQGQGG